MSLVRRLWQWIQNPDLQAILLLAIFALPITLPALKGFFTFDDLMNLNRYVANPVWSVLNNFIVFTPQMRPMGALVNLPLYSLFGMEPFYYYLAGITIFTFNLGLVYLLILRLTENRVLAIMTTALSGYHPSVSNVLYNFRAIFELLAMNFIVIALLSYSSFKRQPDRGIFYWISLLAYVAALNSKEIAVALPPLLVLYELLYGKLWRETLTERLRILKRLVPFAILALPYTVVKTIGLSPRAMDPLYQMHFDSTVIKNLAQYFTQVANFEILFNQSLAILTVLLGFLVSWLLRNPHMAFGLGWGLLTLAPVLLLARTWGLFLYVPLIGFALFVSCLIYEPLFRFWRLIWVVAPVPSRMGLWLRPVLYGLLLGRLISATSPGIHHAQRFHYLTITEPFRSLSSQLFSKYEDMDQRAVVGFQGIPLRYKHFRWIPHFLIWLKYGKREIQIYILPEDRQKFARASLQAQEVHLFEWENGALVERSTTESTPRAPQGQEDPESQE